MSDFRAHIVGDLDLSEARSQMESFLNEYKDKKLKITPEINTSQAQKAGEQAAQRAEKQNYQARKKNADAIMKESLANIEKQSKNKADIIKAQASGKDSTVDILKEQRKQLRSEGRKLQKEMRSYNDIYSPSERSQILRNNSSVRLFIVIFILLPLIE